MPRMDLRLIPHAVMQASKRCANWMKLDFGRSSVFLQGPFYRDLLGMNSTQVVE